MIAGWEHADAGTIERAGTGAAIPGWDELAVVPQKLGLFDELSVRENLEYPARLHGRLEELRARVDELMEDLGIAHLAARYPKETSLGEQQRTAVARALVLSPTLVLADEPTGHQDAVSERRVLEAFGRAAADGASCLIATHNVALSAAAGPRVRDDRRPALGERRCLLAHSPNRVAQKLWPRISPPGKSPGPVFGGSIPSFVWTLTYAFPDSTAATTSARSVQPQALPASGAVTLPAARTPSVRPPPGAPHEQG